MFKMEVFNFSYLRIGKNYCTLSPKKSIVKCREFNYILVKMRTELHSDNYQKNLENLFIFPLYFLFLLKLFSTLKFTFMTKSTFLFLVILCSAYCTNLFGRNDMYYDNNSERQRATIDSVGDTSCLTGATLNATFTGTGLDDHCDFSATVTAYTMSGPYKILGYYWSLPTAGNFFISTNANTNTQHFSTTNNVSDPFSVKIYAVDTMTNDTCTIITLNRTVTCSSGHGTVQDKKNHPLAADNIVVDDKSQITIYPNPTDGIVTISSAATKITNIQIINLLGQKLEEFNFENANEATIKLDKVPNGNFLIRINNNVSKVINKVSK